MMTQTQKEIHDRALQIASNFKKTETELIDILQRAYEEKVFLALGFTSLFEYARDELNLSPANCYTYSGIAKISLKIPEVKKEIESGALSITNAKRIIPIITVENKDEVIPMAKSLSSRELEKKIAATHPEVVRESIRPVSENSLRLNIEISETEMLELKRAQEILSNERRIPVSLKDVLMAGVKEVLKRDPVAKAKRVEEKMARPHRTTLVARPNRGVTRARNRKPIPAAVRNAVLRRDQGACTFIKSNGERCGSRYFVDLHHIVHVASGGANSVENLTTLCRSHHSYWHEISQRKKAG